MKKRSACWSIEAEADTPGAVPTEWIILMVVVVFFPPHIYIGGHSSHPVKIAIKRDHGLEAEVPCRLCM
jgi:hypothetical protein